MLRCAYGRAAATMREYDRVLREGERKNFRGASETLAFLEATDPASYEKIGTLWGLGYLEETLFALMGLARRVGRSGQGLAEAALLDRCNELYMQICRSDSANASRSLEQSCVELCGLLQRFGAGIEREVD